MSRAWRLLCDGDLPGARNMARDVMILEQVKTGACRPTLRLYGWQPPCLSLGRHQDTAAADRDFCRRHSIDVVRRPTGGRAVLHQHELTYSVIAPLSLIAQHLQAAYAALCRPLVTACRGLGIAAELTTDEVNPSLPGPQTTIPCFKAPAAGEVVVAGRKLIGSAMRFHHGVILQHGAILLDWDGRLQAGSMGLADDRQLRPFVTTFAEQLGTPPDRDTLETTIITAYAESFEIDPEPDQLTAAELSREQELASTSQAPIGG